MKRKYIVFLAIAILFIVGCANDIEVIEGDATAIVDTPTSEAASTQEPGPLPVVSDQIYMPASGAFHIQLPEGWNCSESGAYQVNCQSQEMDAETRVRVTSTGYELTEESFKAFIHAELVNRYADKKEYVEIERVEKPGEIAVSASWREGDIFWESADIFIRNRHGIFHLTTVCMQSQKEMHAALFSQVKDSLQMFPDKLQPDALYAFRQAYIAPDAFFEISVPMSWGKFADAATIERTVVEGFLSPDSRASVQVAVYRQSVFIEQSLKADKTREIMHALYGYDLRISHDKALPDGRERLAWYAGRKDINGVSYFDSYGSSLYVLSIIWEKSTEDIYLPVLQEIEGSFTRE